MAKAIDAVGMDLDQAKGKTALIIVSDGLQTFGNAITATQALKDKFGSSLCIYPVLVGNADSGMILMKKFADIGVCGTFSKEEALLSSAGMAAFVKEVFLTKKSAHLDRENDGIINDNDLCPDTPAGVVVALNGCPWTPIRMASMITWTNAREPLLVPELTLRAVGFLDLYCLTLTKPTSNPKVLEN